MGYETILLDRLGNIGFVALKRPKLRNPFSAVLATGYNSALEESEADPF